MKHYQKSQNGKDMAKVKELIKRTKNFLILLLLTYQYENLYLSVEDSYLYLLKYDARQRNSALLMLTEYPILGENVFHSILSANGQDKWYRTQISTNYTEQVNQDKNAKLLLKDKSIPNAVDIDIKAYQSERL